MSRPDEKGRHVTKQERSDREINTREGEPSEELADFNRRSILQFGAMAGAGASLGLLSAPASAEDGDDDDDDDDGGGERSLAYATITELQDRMRSGRLTARRLVETYLRRIRRIDRRLGLNSVIAVNPDAVRIARELDRERREKGARGPLHGIPVMLKDNIDTGDRQPTTAGSLALVGQPALQDATVAARLRAAGAVILGKLNLSEWANARGNGSSSGWSGVAGQCNNPYILDRNPCGSSSGTGAAVSAGLCAAALGTETDGSVVCPASACGVVGIKPTVGLTSRAGVIPISDTQDTVGVHGRTVADAAALLGPMTGVDPRDGKTAASDGLFFKDYTQFADPDGLVGARIGVARQFLPTTVETDQIFEQAVEALGRAGATLVDVNIPSFDQFNADSAELIVLIFEYKRDLNRYLATRAGVPVSTMADVLQFNLDNFEAELRFFGQEFMQFAQDAPFSEADYRAALERGFRLAATEGIDATLANDNLDAFVAPTGSPAWPSDVITGDAFQFGTSSYGAVPGYPLVSVPAGFAFGLPVGMTFFGTAYSEPTLIRLAAGFEAATQVRRPPEFLRTFPGGGRPGGRTYHHFGAMGSLSATPVRARAARRTVRAVRRPMFL